MFEGYKQQFRDFADEQKIERLKGCQALEVSLKECHRYREAMLKTSAINDDETRTASRKDCVNDLNSNNKSTLSWWQWAVGNKANTSNIPEVSSNSLSQEISSEGSKVETAKIDKSLESKQSYQRPALWRGSAPAVAIEQDGLLQGTVTQSENKKSDEADNSSIIEPIPSCEEEAHVLWRCRGLALGCGEHVVYLKKCFKGEIDGDCKQLQINLGNCVKQNALELEKRRRESQVRKK